ncbi:hypothetical protein QWZ10_01090 [Paracoccus cavernae]|uniref:Uncharacterized protein n=1 Tax=Paracoccus cavernae TaxID=1571207 RepID=A0ABT8D1R1_9RHOB|nr:hypothetical protein [Paracoccus cavernae]
MGHILGGHQGVEGKAQAGQTRTGRNMATAASPATATAQMARTRQGTTPVRWAVARLSLAGRLKRAFGSGHGHST